MPKKDLQELTVDLKYLMDSRDVPNETKLSLMEGLLPFFSRTDFTPESRNDLFSVITKAFHLAMAEEKKPIPPGGDAKKVAKKNADMNAALVRYIAIVFNPDTLKADKYLDAISFFGLVLCLPNVSDGDKEILAQFFNKVFEKASQKKSSRAAITTQVENILASPDVPERTKEVVASCAHKIVGWDISNYKGVINILHGAMVVTTEDTAKLFVKDLLGVLSKKLPEDTDTYTSTAKAVGRALQMPDVTEKDRKELSKILLEVAPNVVDVPETHYEVAQGLYEIFKSPEIIPRKGTIVKKTRVEACADLLVKVALANAKERSSEARKPLFQALSLAIALKDVPDIKKGDLAKAFCLFADEGHKDKRIQKDMIRLFVTLFTLPTEAKVDHEKAAEQFGSLVENLDSENYKIFLLELTSLLKLPELPDTVKASIAKSLDSFDSQGISYASSFWSTLGPDARMPAIMALGAALQIKDLPEELQESLGSNFSALAEEDLNNIEKRTIVENFSQLAILITSKSTLADSLESIVEWELKEIDMQQNILIAFVSLFNKGDIDDKEGYAECLCALLNKEYDGDFASNIDALAGNITMLVALIQLSDLDEESQQGVQGALQGLIDRAGCSDETLVTFERVTTPPTKSAPPVPAETPKTPSPKADAEEAPRRPPPAPPAAKTPPPKPAVEKPADEETYEGSFEYVDEDGNVYQVEDVIESSQEQRKAEAGAPTAEELPAQQQEYNPVSKIAELFLLSPEVEFNQDTRKLISDFVEATKNQDLKEEDYYDIALTFSSIMLKLDKAPIEVKSELITALNEFALRKGMPEGHRHIINAFGSALELLDVADGEKVEVAENFMAFISREDFDKDAYSSVMYIFEKLIISSAIPEKAKLIIVGGLESLVRYQKLTPESQKEILSLFDIISNVPQEVQNALVGVLIAFMDDRELETDVLVRLLGTVDSALMMLPDDTITNGVNEGEVNKRMLVKYLGGLAARDDLTSDVRASVDAMMEKYGEEASEEAAYMPPSNPEESQELVAKLKELVVEKQAEFPDEGSDWSDDEEVSSETPSPAPPQAPEDKPAVAPAADKPSSSPPEEETAPSLPPKPTGHRASFLDDIRSKQSRTLKHVEPPKRKTSSKQDMLAKIRKKETKLRHVETEEQKPKEPKSPLSEKADRMKKMMGAFESDSSGGESDSDWGEVDTSRTKKPPRAVRPKTSPTLPPSRRRPKNAPPLPPQRAGRPKTPPTPPFPKEDKSADVLSDAEATRRAGKAKKDEE